MEQGRSRRPLGKLSRAARALYTEPPKADNLLPGLTLADFAGDMNPGVFPDCWLAVRAFNLLSTQWRIGPGGATGLDNAAISPSLQMAGLTVTDAEWPQLFADLRTLEAAALDAMHIKAKT